MKIAFSGHRRIADNSIQDVIAEVMKYTKMEGVTELIFGGAIGIDSICLEVAFNYRKNKKIPKLTVIVPDTVDKQPRNARILIKQYADEIIELKNEIKQANGWLSYRQRNEAMVNRADIVVAFWNGNKKGGTYMTVNLAKKNGKELRIFPLEI